MSESTVLYCLNHPQVETGLRCSRCGNPICPKCAVQTPVGFRCPQCIRSQQAVFYAATPLDYAIATVVGLIMSAVAASVMSRIGIFLIIILGPLTGGLMSEFIGWTIRRRRGRWMWLVVSGSIVIGALAVVLLPFLSCLRTYQSIACLTMIFRVDLILYLALAVGTAYARLR